MFWLLDRFAELEHEPDPGWLACTAAPGERNVYIWCVTPRLPYIYPFMCPYACMNTLSGNAFNKYTTKNIFSALKFKIFFYFYDKISILKL